MTFFNRNIQYLSDYNQWLIEQMESISTDHIDFIRVGEDVVFKQADDHGNEFYTASIYDPVFEAAQFLDGVNFDNTGYILMGMGSSAIIKQILENKTETAWFLIIEKDTALVKKFLEEIDLSPYLEGKLQRIIILTELMEDLSAVLNRYITSLVGYYFLRTDLLRTFSSYRRGAQFYENTIEVIVNHLRTHMTAMGNSLEDTLMGMSNELKNVPIALKSHRIKDLKDKYRGKPIICVASGPSLDKQLPLLKRVKGKALIICAESAFRVLLKNGIAPDVVCILERGPNSYDLSIKGVQIPEDTALIALTLMDGRIPRSWNQYVVPVFKENIVHSRLMNQALGDIGTLYNGNSVAHLNYALAHHLGGSPIVFIGQDLAYSEEGETHSKDSFYVNQSDIEMTSEQRKQIQSSLQNDQSFFNKTVYVDGYYGGQVKSRELWRQFLYWMEHMINVLPAQLVINATEGGADIKGTVKMPFREVVESYCQERIQSIPDLFNELPPVSSEDVRDRLESMVNFFNDQLGEMERISQFAEEILEAAQQLQTELSGESVNTIDFLEMKASRVLRNVEHLLRQILSNTFLCFFYRPLLSNYHVKMNPISRVSSIERLQQILTHQSYFLKRVIEGKQQVIDVYREGIRNAVLELGYDPEEICLKVQPKWELPEDEETEEEGV
ncbi:motility associated factor glycosyltransferase family protein [Brevibacillus sp. H7]|uniref:motility associated factor glycosyltransferase family protein n=1 Tax=Brevibacillus sp. H7 TaxID=3349138 RepID=UPI0037FC442B